jgi:hypothetical protein
MTLVSALLKALGHSPRANYTDLATADCRAKLVPIFADRGSHVVSASDPNGRLLRVSSKLLLSCTHEAEWTPFQTHYSENLAAPGIEPGPLDL